MRAGQLRHRVTLQRPEGTSGFTDVAIRIPAAIALVTPGTAEALRFGAPTSTGHYKVTMRYRRDVKAEWRIVDEGGRVFQIAGYGDPDGRRRELHVFATEIQ